MIEKKSAHTKRMTKARGNLLAACILGGLASLSTFSCSHNSEEQGPNAPSGTAGGDSTMTTSGTGGTTNTMDTSGGTTSTSTNGTGGSGATPAQ